MLRSYYCVSAAVATVIQRLTDSTIEGTMRICAATACTVTFCHSSIRVPPWLMVLCHALATAVLRKHVQYIAILAGQRDLDVYITEYYKYW